MKKLLLASLFSVFAIFGAYAEEGYVLNSRIQLYKHSIAGAPCKCKPKQSGGDDARRRRLRQNFPQIFIAKSNIFTVDFHRAI